MTTQILTILMFEKVYQNILYLQNAIMKFLIHFLDTIIGISNNK